MTQAKKKKNHMVWRLIMVHPGFPGKRKRAIVLQMLRIRRREHTVRPCRIKVCAPLAVDVATVPGIRLNSYVILV